MFYVDCKIYTPDDTNTELHTHKMFKIGKENPESRTVEQWYRLYAKYTPLIRLVSLTLTIGKANLWSKSGVLDLLWTAHSQQAPAPPIFPLPPTWNTKF